MLYADTSLLVAALTSEASTKQARTWLATEDASQLAISDWTVTEVSSAFAIKLRTGQMSLEERAAALAVFNSLAVESFAVLEVVGADFRIAAQFVDQHRLGLRAGDALHIAVASRHGAIVHTLDRRLAEAGSALGVSTQLLV